MSAPIPVARTASTLGEGPAWFHDTLWFVDIKQHKVHRFDPATDALDSWDAPDQVGWVLPDADGGIVAGLKSGLHAFDPASGTFTRIVEIEPDRPGNRLNDATVDAAGRLWFGSMDDGEAAPTGAFYRADAVGIARVIDGIAITNGPAVSPDGALLYHCDTRAGTIHVSDLAADGSLSATRLFAQVDPTDGYPDGPVVDAEGCVWVGLFAGWSVRRYAPDGALLATVRFPVANITKIAFGGPRLATAYATTAAKGLSPEERAAQPDAGHLFAFDPGVAGVPLPAIAAFAPQRRYD